MCLFTHAWGVCLCLAVHVFVWWCAACSCLCAFVLCKFGWCMMCVCTLAYLYVSILLLQLVCRGFCLSSYTCNQEALDQEPAKAHESTHAHISELGGAQAHVINSTSLITDPLPLVNSPRTLVTNPHAHTYPSSVARRRTS